MNYIKGLLCRVLLRYRLDRLVSLKVAQDRTSTTIYFLFLNLSLNFLIDIQSFDTSNTKIPPILLPLRQTGFVCANRHLLQKKPVSKTCGNYAFYVWRVVWCLTKCEWHLISKFSLPLAYCLQNPLANGKHGLVPKEMSQTLLIAFIGGSPLKP